MRLGVFHDPLALSRLDEEHGEAEERWLTLGRAALGRLLVVVHTWVERDEDRVSVRIISARPASRRETRQYEDGS